MYYLVLLRNNFLQTQYDIYRYALQIHYGLVVEIAFTKKSRKLNRGYLEHHGETFSNCSCKLVFIDRRSLNSQGPDSQGFDKDWHLTYQTKNILTQCHVISNCYESLQ